MLLKLTNPLMSGPQVRRVQELLIALGYDLGPYKADGWFGPSSEAAVRKFQADVGLSVDGIVGPRTMDALQISVDALHDDHGVSQVQIPFALIDISGGAVHGCHYRPDRSPISADDMRGFTLHETGCLMGDKLSAWAPVNAQVGIRRNGDVILILPIAKSGPPLPSFVWHAQRLSLWTEGIEIEANPCGVLGDQHTWWAQGGGPYEATDAQIEAARKYLTMRCAALRAKGVNPTWIRAHRQSSNQRQSDPGERIWREVGLWAMANLGLDEGGPDWKVGNGLMLPKQWGDHYTAQF